MRQSVSSAALQGAVIVAPRDAVNRDRDISSHCSKSSKLSGLESFQGYVLRRNMLRLCLCAQDNLPAHVS